MAILAGLFLWRIQAQVSIEGWVRHTNDVMLEAESAEIEFRKMQVNIRSYLLSPKDHYQDNIRDDQDRFNNSMAKMSALVPDNLPQEERLRGIAALESQWMGVLSNVIAGTNAGGDPANGLEAIEPLGHKIQEALKQVIEAERQLLAQRTADKERQDHLLFVLVPLLSGIVGVVLSVWGWNQIRLASNQYAAALASAEESGRLKDNFMAMVSHELRNPLNSIVIWCRTLSKEPASEKWRNGLAAMDRAAKVQAQLIDDLLDSSRIERGQLRLEIQSTNLSEVVKAAIDAMRPAAAAKSISLQEILDPRIGMVAGDPVRLQQVVWNLVSNAVKFTSQGGRVQVRLARTNSAIEIVVMDTGKGLAASSLPRVFDRFWQAQESQGREGVGLGLSIVKEIVNLHGGTVVAHSAGVGRGCTFTVRLPLPLSDTIASQA
ncbi:MAG TPA: ATP-binding protein [Candidatus Binataceae bacterium]|nr:ATP-binding protein [Candidatus Binataceae bacterium]